MIIRDGPVEMRGRATFEPAGPGGTCLAATVEIPGMDESTDTISLTSRLKRSGRGMQQLIEAEIESG